MHLMQPQRRHCILMHKEENENRSLLCQRLPFLSLLQEGLMLSHCYIDYGCNAVQKHSAWFRLKT